MAGRAVFEEDFDHFVWKIGLPSQALELPLPQIVDAADV